MLKVDVEQVVGCIKKNKQDQPPEIARSLTRSSLKNQNFLHKSLISRKYSKYYSYMAYLSPRMPQLRSQRRIIDVASRSRRWVRFSKRSCRRPSCSALDWDVAEWVHVCCMCSMKDTSNM